MDILIKYINSYKNNEAMINMIEFSIKLLLFLNPRNENTLIIE